MLSQGPTHPALQDPGTTSGKRARRGPASPRLCLPSKPLSLVVGQEKSLAQVPGRVTESEKSRQDMVFSPKVARQGPRPHASCVCPGTPTSLRQGCQERGAARVWGCPGGPWLPGHTLTSPCPLGPEWPGKGGSEGGLPARKRSAGWPQASLTPRAGPRLSCTGRDKPGVLTPRP